MRFLLHSTANRTAAAQIRKGRVNTKKTQIQNNSRILVSKTVGSIAHQNNDSYVQSWGQQCSPNCGCVVRFEATLDPINKNFTSATYHAKAVILTRTSTPKEENTTTNNTQTHKLEPAMTLRTNKPMFRPCTCKSLHQLASQVTEYLPNRNALAIGSSMEFSGVRSSPAFRHTVLEKQGLKTTDTHCFDVIEEALTAMVRGYMPKSRPQVSLKEAYAKMDGDDNPFQFDKHLDDEKRVDMSSLSALRMLDLLHGRGAAEHASDYETLASHRIHPKIKETPASAKSVLDWQSYVDEILYQQDVQESA